MLKMNNLTKVKFSRIFHLAGPSFLYFLILFPGQTSAAEWKPETLQLQGGTVEIIFSKSKFGITRKQFIDAINTSIKALTTYYQKFTVPELRLEVIPHDNPTDISGYEFSGRSIQWKVGTNVSADRLMNDWTLTHEMFHLGFPAFDDNYNWLDEGMATYLEPIARARIGNLPVEQVWSDLYTGLPKGLPKAGDKGLANTATWGRTYWGGALFWFLADLQIREKTKNAKSVDTVMRAVLADQGDASHFWSIEQLIRVADQATGFPVLEGLHRRLAIAPGTEDLDHLWKQLGVVVGDETITFNDKAPWAYLRLAITKPADPDPIALKSPPASKASPSPLPGKN